MRIEIRETKQPGIIQVTTLDERWYLDQEVKDEVARFLTSVTWFCGYRPKGIGFYKWLAMKGWDEAQAIKNAAGDKGSKVHHAVDALLGGATVQISDSFPDSEGEISELKPEEWECVMGFYGWWAALKAECIKKGITFEIIAREQVVINRSMRYAGTMDLKLRIGEKIYIIDFKTSQEVWPEYESQVSAYKHCEGMEDVTNLAILQIGYKKNERGWKFNDIEDDFEAVKAAYVFWAYENKDKKPAQKDYPISLSLIDGQENVVYDATLKAPPAKAKKKQAIELDTEAK